MNQIILTSLNKYLLTGKIKQSVVSDIRPFSLYPLNQLTYMYDLHCCMGHDHSLQGIVSQGHGSMYLLWRPRVL